ncbi:MAG: hypothetical protein ABIO49_04370 [Dokdonella sp.]
MAMNIRHIALGAVAIATTSVTADARDGDYFNAFGTKGREQLAFSPSLNIASGFVDFVDVVVQGDGKIVVSATVNNTAASSPSTDFGVLRLNANGTLDTNFGTQGQTIVPFDLGGTNNDVASSVLLQPNGRIVVCGDAGGDPMFGDSDMGVTRLLSSGALDSQFSGDGKATVAFDLGAVGSRGDIAVRCALQSDGKIVAAGRAPVDSTATRTAVARLNTDGSRDTSFNGSGTATIDFGPAGMSSLAFDVKIQPDGRILLTGAASPGGSAISWVLARLTASGQPDLTFGNGGILFFDPGVISYQAYEGLSSTVLSDGSIITAGVMALTPALTNYDYGIFKLTPSGTLDTSFGDNGGKVIPFDLGGGFADAPVKIVEDGQGRLLAAGFSSGGSQPYTISLARLTHDGQLDPSFGTGGKLTVSSTLPPATDFGDQGTGMVIGPDGSIYVSSIAAFDAGNHFHIGLVKLIGDTIFADGFEDQ